MRGRDKVRATTLFAPQLARCEHPSIEFSSMVIFNLSVSCLGFLGYLVVRRKTNGWLVLVRGLARDVFMLMLASRGSVEAGNASVYSFEWLTPV